LCHLKKPLADGAGHTFSTAGAAMDFHMAAIERDLSGSFNRCRDRSEDVLPNAALAPARKAILDSLVWSIFRCAVLPATSYLLNVHDAAQNPPVILALRARLICRQMHHDLRPLLIAKPKQICVHRLGPLMRLTKPLNQ
jgi:hypothetical protein